MDQVVLAATAGVIVTLFAFAVLEASARERLRLEVRVGIERAAARRLSFSMLAGLAALGARVPGRQIAWLAGGDVRQPRFVAPAEVAVMRVAWRGLAILFAAAIVLVAVLTVEPAWLLALVAAPLLARVIAQARLRAREAVLARALERELTGALDIFVLALEAGLPFERAVSAYVETTSSVLGRELGLTVDDLEVGYRRREALDRLVQRTGSAGIASMASAVRLAEEFGTPLAATLRSLAVDLRAQRRNRLREAALRAPVTMLLPTAGLILLPIFAIILGPIALRVATGTLF